MKGDITTCLTLSMYGNFCMLLSFSAHSLYSEKRLGGTCDSTVDFIFEPVHEISNNVVCLTSKASDQPTHIRRAFASRLSIL